VPASTAPSTSSSARSTCSARRFYVRHEVVHNRFVVESLRARGAVFIEELSEVPRGATVIFSAHGVSQAVRKEAAARGFRRCSTPPVHWSPRSTWRCRAIAVPGAT
jgi:4-hydroxy-3-methylbut-2-enyl diphosphate reductase IspH